MDNRSDGLWQGGPWEQPARPFSPPPAVVTRPRNTVLPGRPNAATAVGSAFSSRWL